MALVPPVFVFEGIDLFLFKTLEDAALKIESVDVADEVYEGFDSVGHRITLSARNEKKGSIVIIPGEVSAVVDADSPPDPARLTELIRAHLDALGYSYGTDESLDGLVRHCVTLYERQRDGSPSN